MLEAFIEAVSDLNIHSVVVRGKVNEEHYWSRNITRNIYSGSKSFVSTAVGMAIDEGKLTLDTSVADIFPKLTQRKDILLRHLLTMSIGHVGGYLMDEERLVTKEKDWLAYALSIPTPDPAGHKFNYDNSSTFIVASMIEEAVGMNLVDYLMPRLFSPLEIERPFWNQSPEGHTFGASELYLKTSDFVKLGLLYLANGEYKGKRLLSEYWVKIATSKQIELGEFGWGYNFWLGPNGSFRADGKLSQYCVAFPDKMTAVAVNSTENNMGAVLGAIMDKLYNAI